jgi:hypothetical protein
MPGAISHNRDDESMEAKTAWFQSLTVEERIRVFNEWCELILAANPNIVEQKDAQPIPGRVRVLRSPRR